MSFPCVTLFSFLFDLYEKVEQHIKNKTYKPNAWFFQHCWHSDSFSLNIYSIYWIMHIKVSMEVIKIIIKIILSDFKICSIYRIFFINKKSIYRILNMSWLLYIIVMNFSDQSNTML